MRKHNRVKYPAYSADFHGRDCTVRFEAYEKGVTESCRRGGGGREMSGNIEGAEAAVR